MIFWHVFPKFFASQFDGWLRSCHARLIYDFYCVFIIHPVFIKQNYYIKACQFSQSGKNLGYRSIWMQEFDQSVVLLQMKMSYSYFSSMSCLMLIRKISAGKAKNSSYVKSESEIKTNGRALIIQIDKLWVFMILAVNPGNIATRSTPNHRWGPSEPVRGAQQTPSPSGEANAIPDSNPRWRPRFPRAIDNVNDGCKAQQRTVQPSDPTSGPHRSSGQARDHPGHLLLFPVAKSVTTVSRTATKQILSAVFAPLPRYIPN